MSDRTDETPDGKEWRRNYVRTEVDRLLREHREHPERGSRPEDRVARLERIVTRDAARHLPDFNPERTRELEDFEIRSNPEGYLARHAGEGLDPATEREVRRALAKRRSG
ncbi:MAG: hypothetical protein Q8R92_15485 [Deltaproteobacteria bacterium]|nr:hypothetical protein [Deltaproteobacteria bacterium]